MIVEELVAKALKAGASDIHLVRGLPPRYRVDWEIWVIAGEARTSLLCDVVVRELPGR